jgi:hypothetical protein
MNGLQVRGVESPRDGRVDQLCNSSLRAMCFEVFQNSRISETAQAL